VLRGSLQTGLWGRQAWGCRQDGDEAGVSMRAAGHSVLSGWGQSATHPTHASATETSHTPQVRTGFRGQAGTGSHSKLGL
jgi:hypothetical protein